MARNHLFTQQVWQAPAVRTLRHLFSPERVYRYLSAARRSLPNYLIAGAQKSGTTSLWGYLSEHPQVAPPMRKEMSFFDVNFHCGLNWYRMHFPLDATPGHQLNGNGNGNGNGTGQHGPAGSTRLTGESTAYYMFHPLAPMRIAQALPQAKIILLLRNPVSRAFSHYQLKLRRRQETLTFDEAIDAEPERLAGQEEKILANPRYYSAAHDRFSYLARGEYLSQVRRWQQFFPPSQLLILESGEFFQHTADVFNQVLDFLGLKTWHPSQFGNRFPGNYTEKMHDRTRRRLVEYFAPHNAQLYAHLGRSFDWDR